MFVFTRGDIDGAGQVSDGAVQREQRLFPGAARYLSRPLLNELHKLAVDAQEQKAMAEEDKGHVQSERVPPGMHIELQVGRSVENKIAYRFDL